MSTKSIVGYVLSSSVRSDVLTAAVAEPRSIDGLIESIDASESAVYNAVADLERRGLVRKVDDEWDATGSGQLVSDLLEQQGNLCQLLSDDYWRDHDVSSLPRNTSASASSVRRSRNRRGSDETSWSRQ